MLTCVLSGSLLQQNLHQRATLIMLRPPPHTPRLCLRIPPVSERPRGKGVRAPSFEGFGLRHPDLKLEGAIGFRIFRFKG